MDELYRVARRTPAVCVNENNYFRSPAAIVLGNRITRACSRVNGNTIPTGSSFVHHGVGSEAWSADDSADCRRAELVNTRGCAHLCARDNLKTYHDGLHEQPPLAGERRAREVQGAMRLGNSDPSRFLFFVSRYSSPEAYAIVLYRRRSISVWTPREARRGFARWHWRSRHSRNPAVRAGELIIDANHLIRTANFELDAAGLAFETALPLGEPDPREIFGDVDHPVVEFETQWARERAPACHELDGLLRLVGQQHVFTLRADQGAWGRMDDEPHPYPPHWYRGVVRGGLNRKDWEPLPLDRRRFAAHSRERNRISRSRLSRARGTCTSLVGSAPSGKRHESCSEISFFGNEPTVCQQP